MEATKINISDYTQEVLQIAKANSLSIEEAFDRFLANLAVMREHYKGAKSINYHELGQKWNALPNAEKLAQKANMRARLSKYS